MKCTEVRKLIQLYLDSELDSKESLDVAEHLKSCAECAGLFEAEKNFAERVNRFLREGSRTPSLWTAIESRIESARAPARLFSLSWLGLATAAAILIFAAAAFFWVNAQPLDLAKAAGQCHSAYLQELASPEFTGAVPHEIEKDIAGQLDVAAFAYHPSATGFSSRGARFCQIANVPCALIMGNYGKVPVSVIVFEKARLAQFPQARGRLASGERVLCSRSGRYHFAMRTVDGHVVCVVAEASKSVVEDLAKSVTDKT